MKRVYGIVILLLLGAALLTTLRMRDDWVDRAVEGRRARRIESATPRWPDLSGAPQADRPVEPDAD